MTDLKLFKGLLPAFYAAYDDSGEISARRNRRQAEFFAEKGMKGLFLNGSAGEALLLSPAERKRVVEAVVPSYRDQLTMIVHVGAATTKEAVELARHAQENGAHAVAAVPCVYYPLNDQGVMEHWLQIAHATSLPFLLYNIPQYTGYALSDNLLRQMIEQIPVLGVKNTSPEVYDIARFRAIGGPDFIIFNGPDEQYLAGRIMGADGGIGGTYGAMPELYLALERLYQSGQIGIAQELQLQINVIIRQLLQFPSVFAAAKGVLKLRGIDLGSVRAPLLPLRETNQEGVRLLHQQIMQLVEQWA